MNSLSQRTTDRNRSVAVGRVVVPSPRADRWLDVLCLVVLTAIVVGAFYKTIFLGLPVSRIGMIAEWDSLFASLRRGGGINIDPSAVLLALPTYTTIADHYHAGQLPLWNNLSAFGSPLVGDIQATVFSPLRCLFNIIPSMQSYNLQLVAQVEIAAIGTFFLCRNLAASRIASCAAAIAYAFCPFVLWYLELQSGVGYALNPLVMWLFVRMARLASLRSAIIAGLGSGATIMMGHPETSFFAIIFGCVAAGVWLWPRFVSLLKLVGTAGLAAFCTCAPTFLPFIEYAKNSDCYKYSVAESAFMPWQSIVLNLFSPIGGGASPFLGVLLVGFAAVGFCRERLRPALSMAVVAVLTLILSAKLWPFSMVSNVPPFNYLITVYAVPLLLLALCGLFALGLTRAAESRVLAALEGIVLAVAVPMWLHLTGFDWSVANFDMTLPATTFKVGVWTRDFVIATLAVVTLTAAAFVWMRRPRRFSSTVLVLALAGLNSISVLCVAKSALPAQPKFDMPSLAVMNFLHDSGERTIAVGTHLEKPDVNLLYGVDDVRSINAMLPPRYVSFVKACGASADEFTQWFGDELSPLIDFGSVRYVLSQTPVTSTGDHPRSKQLLRAVDVDGVGVLTRGSLSSDLNNRHVVGEIDWQLEHPFKTANLRLLNSQGVVVWFSDREPVTGNQFHQRVRVPLPSADFQNYSLDAVFDNEHVAPIGHVPPPAVADGESRLVLRKQFDGIRLYENLTAMPRAYFVADYAIARDPQDALAQIQQPDFPRHTRVVLEHAPRFPAGGISSEAKVKLIERHSDEIKIHYQSPRPGMIVVTDTFYPGWKAFVDGKRAQIDRANYLFRGVTVPAGEHTLVMRYYPESFTIGVLLFIAFWGFAVVAFVRKAI